MKTQGQILTFTQGHHEEFELNLGCVYVDPDVAAAELAELLEEVKRVREACRRFDDDIDDDDESGLPTYGIFGVRADGAVVRTWLTESERIADLTTKLPAFGFKDCDISLEAEFTLRPIMIQR